MANSFVNCRVDFLFRNIFDTIGQLVQMILVSPEQPGTFLANWRIVKNLRGAYGHALLVAQRSAKKTLDEQTLAGSQFTKVTNASKAGLPASQAL